MRTNSVVLPIFSLALVCRLDLTSTTRIHSSGIRLGVGWFDALVFLVGLSGWSFWLVFVGSLFWIAGQALTTQTASPIPSPRAGASRPS